MDTCGHKVYIHSGKEDSILCGYKGFMTWCKEDKENGQLNTYCAKESLPTSPIKGKKL
jgi:hypothetical protein